MATHTAIGIGVAIIILLGWFWKRATWQGAVAALVITPTVSLLWNLCAASCGLVECLLLPGQWTFAKEISYEVHECQTNM